MIGEKQAPDTSPVEAEQEWLTCDGVQLREMVAAGLAFLEHNHQLVNALNVFPVPDGDTGTNMLLTMRAAYKRIHNGDERSAAKVANDLSYGALMGARGNSGVILSQIWRGFAKSLADKSTLDAADFAAALNEASETAYKGVMRPVEGTILTVIREGAEEAGEEVGKSSDLSFLLARVLERCQQALARTPDMLPVLKQAGVVDAGGQGLVYILEGMLRYMEGELIDVGDQIALDDTPAQAKAVPAGGLENPYDVQFILMGDRLDVNVVRDTLNVMGDSTLVVGDEKTIKVHIHVKDPGKPISYGAGLGKITDVVVENMQLQMEEIIGDHIPVFAQSTDIDPDQIGVVAVAAGDGLARIFQSLGAAAIVDGGQSNNPSTEEIFRAITDIPTDKVVVLPNNKNIILAAKAARDLSTKQVEVVPTRNFPQGISALLALESDDDVEAASAAMEAASQQVASGEIAVATRAAELDGVTVAEGEIIGVVNGQLCVSATDLDYVLACVLDEMDVENRELVSIYYGREVEESEAQKLVGTVRRLYPDAEVELLSGGQSIYQYILGAE